MVPAADQDQLEQRILIGDSGQVRPCLVGQIVVPAELRDNSTPTFRQLQHRCDGVSSSVLADRLRELGQADLVQHAGDGYTLTGQGTTLLECLAQLDAWAGDWRPRRQIDRALCS